MASASISFISVDCTSAQQSGRVNPRNEELSSRMRPFVNYLAGFLLRAFQNFNFSLRGIRITYDLTKYRPKS